MHFHDLFWKREIHTKVWLSRGLQIVASSRKFHPLYCTTCSTSGLLLLFLSIKFKPAMLKQHSIPLKKATRKLRNSTKISRQQFRVSLKQNTSNSPNDLNLNMALHKWGLYSAVAKRFSTRKKTLANCGLTENSKLADVGCKAAIFTFANGKHFVRNIRFFCEFVFHD